MEISIDKNKQAFLDSAQAAYENSDLDNALLECKKVLAIDPNNADAHEISGNVYSKNNFPQLTYESYNKAALSFLNNGQSDKALSVFKKITELDSSKLSEIVQTNINYARGYIKIEESLSEEKFEMAIELMGKILKFRPDDPIVQVQLTALNGKISQLPVSIQTYQNLGDVFFKNNLFEKAQEMFTKITDIDPHNQAVRLYLAQVHLKEGAISEAKKEFLNLAEEAYAKGYFDQAFDLAQKAIELKSVEARYISGLIYFKQEKFEEAVIEFEILLRFKTNHLGALVNLGKTLDMLGRLEKAKAAFQKALEIDNENPEVQEAWIDFCIRIKDIERAIPNMTAILDKAVTGNNAEMVVKYSKLMIRLEPDNIATHKKLINALETLGGHEDASEALYRLALLYERKKQFNDAADCLEKALLLSPHKAHAIEKALERIGKTDAKATYGVAIEVENPIIFKNSDFWDGFDPLSGQLDASFEPVRVDTLDNPLSLADVCAQKGFLKAAIEIYQQILESNPGSEEARKSLAEVSGLYLKKLTGPK